MNDINSQFRKDALKKAEALKTDAKWLSNVFVNTYNGLAKSETLQGTITNTSTAPASTVSILDSVVKGYETYNPVDFLPLFTTNTTVLYVPVMTSGSAVVETTGSTCSWSNADISFAWRKVDDITRKGANVSWRKDFVQDVTFDTMSVLTEQSGKDLKRKIFVDLRALLQPIATGAAGTSVPGATTLGYVYMSGAAPSFSEFVNIAKAQDVSGYGPTPGAAETVMLVSPGYYWGLLKNQEFVSTLYETSGEAIKNGVLKTTLGVDVIKADIKSGSREIAYCFNKNRSMCLVQRTGVEVEPYEYPDTDTYGFVISQRIKPVILNTGSIIIAYDA